MANIRSRIYYPVAIITLSILSVLATWYPKVAAHGNFQATPTPRTLSTFGSGVLRNSVRTASLGGPGGGGEVDAEVVIGPCESQGNLSTEAENRWSINRLTVYINDEATNFWAESGYTLPYPDFSVAYCGNYLNFEEVFVTLTTPDRQKIALRPEDGYRFEHTFMPFHPSGKYLLNIRNSDFELIQHTIEVVRVYDGYQGFRLSIVNPSIGKQTAWIQRGEALRVNYYSPQEAQIIEASLYPPTFESSDEIETSENYDPAISNFLFSGSLGGNQALFRPYDLSASEIWNVETNQTQTYSETLIFPTNAPLGIYSLMVGEARSLENNVDHLEPSDADGNLISALGVTNTNDYRMIPLGTDYLYQIAILNHEPIEYTPAQNIPISYIDAYGAKYASFVLNVKETMAIQTSAQPIEVILSSHGSRVSSYDSRNDGSLVTYILPGSNRYLMMLSESLDQGVASFKFQSLGIDEYVSQLIQEGKQSFRNGDLDNAISYWRKAVELKPELTRVHNLLCWTKGLGGRESFPKEVDAFSDCYKAVAQGVTTNDPRLSLYYDSRGITYAQMGMLEEAATDFERYLTKYPNDTKRQRWITELRAGRNPFKQADKTLNESLFQELQKEPI